jgi:hypothetical protein
MQEKTLLQVSVVVALVGVIILFLISGRIDFNKESIINAEGGDSVRVVGVVKSIESSEKFSKINIVYEEEADIVVFDDINLSEGSIIEVVGTKNKEKEILADKIKISYLNN